MSLTGYLNSKRLPIHLTSRPSSQPNPPSSSALTFPTLTEKVTLITVDGRTLIGTLIACDQVTNLVLQDTIERIIRPASDEELSAEQPHGLYLVRGDNVVVCGLVDEEIEKSIDWTKVRGEAIGSTKHV
jgi:U6 snRNA-associated Sm-like protein LSm8